MWRLLSQTFSVLVALWYCRGLKTVMMQNPPTVPSGLAVRALCWIRGATFIVDCHNYGWTILRLKGGNRLWRIMKAIEAQVLKFADVALCVSQAMKDDLMQTIYRHRSNEEQSVLVLRDQPPTAFRHPSDMTKHLVLTKYLRDSSTWTEKNGAMKPLSERPFIVLTSTSYTADEKVDMLLEALGLYVQRMQSKLPKLTVIVTGKGPLREKIAAQWAAMADSVAGKVSLHQIFGHVDDYPALIGCADLGVSLHQSSSGLDLPMKVVDLLGVGVPVVSCRYPAISELIKDEKALFTTPRDLAELIATLASDPSALQRLQNNAPALTTWEEEWNRVILPHFVRCC